MRQWLSAKEEPKHFPENNELHLYQAGGQYHQQRMNGYLLQDNQGFRSIQSFSVAPKTYHCLTAVTRRLMTAGNVWQIPSLRQQCTHRISHSRYWLKEMQIHLWFFALLLFTDVCIKNRKKGATVSISVIWEARCTRLMNYMDSNPKWNFTCEIDRLNVSWRRQSTNNRVHLSHWKSEYKNKYTVVL